MEAIKETINKVFKELTEKKQGRGQDGPEEWLKKILTKIELRHIRVDYFRKGILGVSVDSSGWLYMLGIRKKSILAALKKESREIKELRLRIREV